MKVLKTSAAAMGLIALAGAGQAALIDRGDGMIYDTTRNITWLADMNYAKTSGYDADGRMTWDAAKQWADNLVYGGYGDWRLPTLNPYDKTCSGFVNPGGGFPRQYVGANCQGGELSGLFVTDLGNKASESVLNQNGDTQEQIANLALFSHVMLNAYWAGVEFEPNTSSAWFFGTDMGHQDFSGKGGAMYAVAVRPGDVAAAVPEPQTLALALLVWGGLLLARKTRPR